MTTDHEQIDVSIRIRKISFYSVLYVRMMTQERQKKG
ncbi:hypothetical protein P615_20875 [Brevibacillus laterosporus PE36]|nr:hypothetical protein P615_20875 [Brevibacillus laterosporus PE36]